MRIWVKIAAACIGFVPMVLLYLSAALTRAGLLPENIGRHVAVGCGLVNYPAFSALTLIHSFYPNLSRLAGSVILFGMMLFWASFLACVLWRIAGEFLGEGEPEFETNPEHAKFDWAGFRVRFVCGFVIGFLLGWRLVRYSTSGWILLTAMTVVGLLVGLGFGLYRPNFWSRS